MTANAVEVVFTREFRRQAKRARVPPDKIEEIIDALRLRPESGALIPGTGGARKVRFAGRGKGKRGGYRVVTGLVVFEGTRYLFLFDIFAKGDRVDLTQGQRNWIRARLTYLRSSQSSSTRSGDGQ